MAFIRPEGGIATDATIVGTDLARPKTDVRVDGVTIQVDGSNNLETVNKTLNDPTTVSQVGVGELVLASVVMPQNTFTDNELIQIWLDAILIDSDVDGLTRMQSEWRLNGTPVFTGVSFNPRWITFSPYAIIGWTGTLGVLVGVAFTKMPGPTVFVSNDAWDNNGANDGEVRWLGPSDTVIELTAVMSISPTANGSTVIGEIRRNGVTINSVFATTTYQGRQAPAEPQSAIPVQATAVAATNDVFSFWVSSPDGAQSMDLLSGSLLARALPPGGEAEIADIPFTVDADKLGEQLPIEVEARFWAKSSGTAQRLASQAQLGSAEDGGSTIDSIARANTTGDNTAGDLTLEYVIKILTSTGNTATVRREGLTVFRL